MSYRSSRRVSLAAAFQLLIISLGGILPIGCAGISQPAYIDDAPKAKAQDCQSRGQNTQDCVKDSAAK